MKKALGYLLLFAYRLTMFAPVYLLAGGFALCTGINGSVAQSADEAVLLAAMFYSGATLIPLLFTAVLHGRWRLFAVVVGMIAYLIGGLFWVGYAWPCLIFIALNIFAWLTMAHFANVAPGMRYGTNEMIWGVALHLLAPIVIKLSGSTIPYQLFAIAGTAFLVLCMFVLNDASVRDGMALRGQGKPLRQLSRVNRWLVGTVVVIGLIVANFESLREWTFNLFRQIGNAILAFFAWLSSLLQSTDELGTPDGEGGGGFGLPAAEPHVEQWWEILIQNIFKVIIVLVIAAFVGFLLYKLYKGIRKLIKLIREYAQRYAGNMRADYQDEQESLMDWGELASEWKDSAMALINKLRTREKRWSDMDNRERVRFTMRSLYRKNDASRLQYLSAREALNEMSLPDAAQKTLGDAYDRARYSAHEISDADVESAKTAAAVKPKEVVHRSDSDIIM